MTLLSSDINFTFSGGSTNTDPNQSLGGEPSIYPISYNRLFDDVTESQAKSGIVDYRCFYINNESNSDSLYNALIYVDYLIPGDVTVKLGFEIRNERQNLTITNAPFVTGGSFVLIYTSDDNYEFVVNWDSNLSALVSNLQAAIQNISKLEDVIVSGFSSGQNLIFEIDFLGNASKRYHELLLLKTNGNNLMSSQPTTINIVKSVSGSPINRIADVIDVDTTVPTFVEFSNQINIGSIRPLDSIPIWIERTVSSNATPVENDGFVLKIRGNAVPDINDRFKIFTTNNPLQDLSGFIAAIQGNAIVYNVDGDVYVNNKSLINGDFNINNLEVSGTLNLSYCTNLQNLRFSNNSLTSINLEGCTSLQGVYANNDDVNILSNLNLNNCNALTNLEIIISSILGDLDLSNKTLLTSLNLSFSKFSSLNVSGCSSLLNIDVQQSDLISIDVSDCSNLITLYAAECEFLNDLSLLNNNDLSLLNISECNFTSIPNIFACQNLESFAINYNPLTSIYIDSHPTLNVMSSSNCTSLTAVTLTNCPNLLNVFSSNGILSSFTMLGSSQVESVNLGDNDLSTVTIDAIFDELVSTVTDKSITVSANPGFASADQTIATNKGWLVY